MKLLISYRVEIANRLFEDFSNTKLGHMVHRERLYLQFLDVYPLVRINIPYGYVYDILKGNLVYHPIESWNFGQACGVSYWKAMVVLVVALSWVAKVGMGIHPDDFQVLVVGVEGVESGGSDCVVSPYGQHDAVRMFFEASQYAIVDLSKQIVEQLQVSHVMVCLFFVNLCWFVVSCADITQVDCFNLIFFLEGLEEIGLSDDIRSGLNTLDVLPLPNGPTEEEQLLARGYFDFFTSNHGTTPNKLYLNKYKTISSIHSF